MTWRLPGSLPVVRIAGTWTSEGAKFGAFDWLLDVMDTGPQWLIRPDIAQIVVRSLFAGQNGGESFAGQNGRRFWSRDYFDRWMRNAAEEQRVIRYIENNPVRAGLCREAEDWLYSSASARRAERA